jgi:hypothetical protein
MRTVEKIKQDQQLKQYFLWYLKASFQIPKIMQIIMHPGGIEGTHGIELILNQEKSSKALITELKSMLQNLI